MALGTFSIDFDWDPELFAELIDGRGVLIFWGEQLIYGGIKLGDNPSQDGITITGVAPEWLLGSDTVGPTLEDKVYVAGNNKLANPAFVYLGSEETKDIHTGDPTTRVTADAWKLPDPTGWVIASGSATSTTALTDGLDLDPSVTLPGDILTSDEKFETFGGDLWRAQVTAERLSGSIGHLRIHLVYDGHFTHPNLLDDPLDWTLSELTSGDGSISSDHFTVGPITQPQGIDNPSFEQGVDADGQPLGWAGTTGNHGWSVDAASLINGPAHSGSYFARCTGGIAGDPGIMYLVANMAFPAAPKPGERYRLDGYARVGPEVVPFGPTTNGDSGEAKLGLAITRASVTPLDWATSSPPIKVDGTGLGDSPMEGGWHYTKVDLDIPDGTIGLLARMAVSYTAGPDGLFMGVRQFDDVRLTRIAGNTVTFTAPPIAVVGEESYTLKALVTAAAGVTDGTVGFSLLFKGPGRPDQTIDGASIDNSATAATLLESPFLVPDGYNSVTVSLVGTDILGGAFTVGIPTMTLTDNKRFVADLGIISGALGSPFLDSTAPAGSEHVHLELIAEDKGAGWKAHSASLARREPPWTSGAVARDLLNDPLTGNPLVTAGNIVGSEIITFDWHVRNLTRRAQLQHLSRSGLAEPEREWHIYVTPAGIPVMDWGTPPAIFTDHRDLNFRENDLKVIGLPVMEHSAETRVTRVKVVGADRQRPDGPPVQITGVATNPNTDFLDWFGQPLNRTETVTEPSADHIDYAASLAAYRASLAARPIENIRMAISDWKAWGPFNVGDWVYVNKPDARIEDPSNPMLVDGQTIWPKKLRVISRTWHLGADFRIEIHRPGLPNYVVPDELVRWDPDTTAELELGNPLPEFQSQSDGDAAYNQLVRFRASMPR